MSTYRVEAETDTRDANMQLKHYYRYGACSRGIAVTWALLTLCFMIINIIVFIEPEWIGDTEGSRSDESGDDPGSPGVGYVGLYQLCEFVSFGHQRVCDGRFQDFSTILTDAFRASTFFVGVSVLLIFLCVLFFLLFLCVYEVYVFIACGVLQVISTIFMFLGCVIFPAGWNHMYVRRICGDDVGKHDIGKCEMRWAYILAIIGIFDILVLAILAFLLAARHRRRWTNIKQVKQKPPKDENSGYVVQVAPGSVLGGSNAPDDVRFRGAPSTYQESGYVVQPTSTNGGTRRRGVSASSSIPPSTGRYH